MKVGERWVPAVYGLLPEHTEKTYRLHNELIKNAIKNMGLQIKIKSIMTDYEVGIQKAAEDSFPEVKLRGCRFHYAQVLTIPPLIIYSQKLETYFSILRG